MTWIRPSSERLPQPAVVVGRFERRVHLHERAEPGVVVDVEEQMVRAGFGRDQAAMIGQQVRFVAGRNVQHVKAVLVPHGQVDRPPRGDDRGRVVANRGCDRRRWSCPARRAAFARTVASSSQWAQIGSVVSAKIASRAAWSSTSRSPVLEPMKILMPGVRVACLQLGQVVRRRADVKAVIHQALARRPGRASRRSRSCGGRRRHRCWASPGTSSRPLWRRPAWPCADPPCASAPARGNGPGRRSRRASRCSPRADTTSSAAV